MDNLCAELQAACAADLHQPTSTTNQTKIFHGLFTLQQAFITATNNKNKNNKQTNDNNNNNTLQSHIESTLKAVTNAGTGSQPLHAVVARTWSLLFLHGDTRNLLQVANDCLTAASSKTTTNKARLCALRVLAELCRTQGRLLAGHLPDILIQTQKLTKDVGTSNNVELRCEVLETLSCALRAAEMAGKSSHADAFKLAGKLSSTDKVAAVRTAACEVLRSLCLVSNNFTGSPALGADAMIAQCFKLLSDPSHNTANAAARTLAQLLAAVTRGSTTEAPAKPTTPTPTQTDTSKPNSEMALRFRAQQTKLFAAMTSARKRMTQTTWLTVAQAFTTITDSYNKLILNAESVTSATMTTSTAPQTRRAHVRALAQLVRLVCFNETPSVEISVVLQGILSILPITSSSLAWERRAGAAYVLRYGLGETLSELEQVDMCSRLVLICEGTDPESTNQDVCLVALGEIGRLITLLGLGARKVRKQLTRMTQSLLRSPHSLVRQQAAGLLRSIVLAMPDSLPPIASSALEMLGNFHADVSTSSSSTSSLNDLTRTLNALDGHVLALSCVLHASAILDSAYTSHILPSFVAVSVLGNAKALVARQFDRTMHGTAAESCACAGWSLVSALVMLGPSFCRHHLVQLTGLWTTGLSAWSDSQEPLSIAMMRCVSEALNSLELFLRANQLLLEKLPVVSEAITVLLSKAIQSPLFAMYNKTNKHLPEFLRIQTALFEACMHLPTELNPRVQTQLMSLALGRISNDTRYDSSLGRTGMLFDSNDDVLRTIGTRAEDLQPDAPQPPISGSANITFATSSNVSFSVRPSRFDGGVSMATSTGFDSDAFWLALKELRPMSEYEASVSATAVMAHLTMLALQTANKDKAFDSEAATYDTSILGNTSKRHCDSLMHNTVPHPSLGVRVTDTALLLFGSHFARADVTVQDQLITKFVSLLKQSTPRVSRNILIAIACATRALSSSFSRQNQAQIQTKPPAWLNKITSLLCVALASPQAIVRRASAQSIGFLAKAMDNTGYGSKVVSVVSQQIEANSKNPFLKAGAVMAFACIRREAGVHFRNHFVTDLCKQTVQPARTWALHSWHLVVDSGGVDINKYVKVTLALINAHMLDGGLYRDGPASYSSMLVCLIRLLNSLLAGLGPELSSVLSSHQTIIALWDIMRRWPSALVQYECLRTLQLLALFAPTVLLSASTSPSPVQSDMLRFVVRHVWGSTSAAVSPIPGGSADGCCPSSPQLGGVSSRDQAGPIVSTTYSQRAAVNVLLRLADRDARFLVSTDLRKLLFAVYESVGRKVAGATPVVSFVGGGDGGLAGLSLAEQASMAAAHRDGLELREAICDFVARSVRWAVTEEADVVLCDWVLFCRGVVVSTGVAGGGGPGDQQQTKKNENDEDEGDNDDDGDDDDDVSTPNGGEPTDSGAATALTWQEQVERASIAQPDGLVLDLLGVLHDDNERQAMHEFTQTHLAEASWETKVLGVRCVIQIVRGVRGINRHVDLICARKNSRKGRNETCLVQYLSELVTGMCQVTTGTVCGHQVHTMQRAGLCALGAIVDCFNKATDPDMGSSMLLLQQYEAQLNATLRPLVSSSSGSPALRSPVLVRDAGALIVKMLVSGITSASSAKRCVSALASPDVLRAGRLHNDTTNWMDGGDSVKEDDGNDSDNSQSERSKLSGRVRTQILLARIDALAQLHIAANRNAILSATGMNEPPSKPLALTIRSALEPHAELLQRLWITATRDYALLVMASDGAAHTTTEDVQKRTYGSEARACRHPTSLFVDMEDGLDVLTSSYVSMWWVYARALAATIKRARLSDHGVIFEQVLTVCTIWIAQGMDGWADRAVVFNVLDTLTFLFSTKLAVDVKNEWLSLDALTALTQVLVRVCVVNAPTRGSAVAEQCAALKLLGRIAQWYPELWKQSLFEAGDNYSHAFMVFEGIVGGSVRPLLAYPGRGSNQSLARKQSGSCDELLNVALKTLCALNEYWPEQCISSFDQVIVRVCDDVLGGKPLSTASVTPPRSPARPLAEVGHPFLNDKVTTDAAVSLLSAVLGHGGSVFDETVCAVANVVTGVFDRHVNSDIGGSVTLVAALGLGMQLINKWPKVLSVDRMSEAWLNGLSQPGCIKSFTSVWEGSVANISVVSNTNAIIQRVLPKALAEAMREGADSQVVVESVEVAVAVGLASVSGGDQCMSVAVALLLAVAARGGDENEKFRSKARSGLLALATRAPEGFKRRIGQIDADTRALLQQEVGHALREARAIK